MSTTNTEPLGKRDQATKGGVCSDEAGKRYALLTVLAVIDSAEGKRATCRCECGAEKVTLLKYLRSGATRSCGCLREIAKIKHGCAFGGRKTREYVIWKGIKYRTQNPSCKGWKDYGGRGIGMHAEWIESFPSFLAYVGAAPSPKHSIDRIDNNKGYEPGNVRWATHLEQCHNMRSNVLNEHKVRRIRELRAAGLTSRSIAEQMDASTDAIAGVIYGKSWRSVA